MNQEFISRGGLGYKDLYYTDMGPANNYDYQNTEEQIYILQIK